MQDLSPSTVTRCDQIMVEWTGPAVPYIDPVSGLAVEILRVTHSRIPIGRSVPGHRLSTRPVPGITYRTTAGQTAEPFDFTGVYFLIGVGKGQTVQVENDHPNGVKP